MPDHTMKSAPLFTLTAELSPLKRALVAIEELQAKVEILERQQREPIAIIGMGCRIPGGANDPEAFWTLLREGRSGIGEIPAERWNVEAYYDPNPDAPGKIATRFGGFLDRVDHFEPQFFGIAPREALTMDPQQRLLLEVSWEALENAAQSPTLLAQTRTGVYFGVCSSDYEQLLLKLEDPAILDMYYASGIARSIASGRLSYILGLQGPSLTVDTACSSSLVAVHLACQGLRNQDCRVALAGGAGVILSPEVFSALSRSRMLAPEGRCKTFDAGAEGFVRAEGCGVVVLKRLSDALADQDRILAVIRGSAINQDGPSSGLTAPSGPAQESVIRDALTNARVSAHEVSYVETHGTGTALGDPIEAQALGAVFGPGRDPATPLWVGSLKTNVGHLEAAAGVTGLIKAVLSLQHREIPQHLHFQKPSPHIPWERLPLKVPLQQQEWTPLKGKRIAGVSAFGFSGTNAHVVLEEAPPLAAQPSGDRERPLHLLTLSARNDAGLKAVVERYVQSLEERNTDSSHSASLLPNFCHTANVGRAHLSRRLAVIGADVGEMSQRLQQCLAGETPPGVARGNHETGERPRIAFLFTGQGSQYVGMGQQLYKSSPIFARALDRCDAVLRDCLGRSVLGVLYPERSEASQLNQTQFTQPALFALEYALSEVWRSWGVQPSFVLGHSVGEYVAACVAGVLTVEDGLKLIAERGRLMQALPPGGRMAAVMAPAEMIRQVMGTTAARVSVAALNGPCQTVISGAGEEVASVLVRLASAGINAQELTVSHAFHSPLMEPMLSAFEQAASRVTFNTPRLRLVSNVTGRFATQGELTQPVYWRRHVREPVQFAASMQTLETAGCTVYLELGPNPVLLGLGRACVDPKKALWLASLRNGRDDWSLLLDSLGQLYAHGAEVDWAGFDRDYSRRKLALPTYPFQRERFWPKAKPKDTPRATETRQLHPLAERRVASPSLSDIVFETRVSATSLGFVNDHRVFGTVVFPAAGYLEAVRAAADLGLGGGKWVIKDMVIEEALTFGDSEEKRFQIILSPAEKEVARFQIFSAEAGLEMPTDGWRLHATGNLRLESNVDSSGHLDFSALQLGAEEMPATVLYQAFEKQGLGFGLQLRGLQKLWRRPGSALGLAEAPAIVEGEMADYGLHPALLDACIQVVGAAVNSIEEMECDTSLFMPLGVESFRFFGPAASRLWSEAVLDPTATPSAQTFKAHIRIANDEGRLVAELRGVSFKRADRATLERAIQKGINDWFYEIAWTPLDKSIVIAQKRVPLPELEPLAAPLLQQLQTLTLDSGLNRFEQVRSKLDAACVSYIAKALRSLGCRATARDSLDTTTFAKQLGVAPQQRKLLARFLEILAEEKLLELSDSGGRWLAPLPAADAAATLASLGKEYPEFDAIFTIVERCGAQLAEALAGRADPLQLLFPAGDTTIAEKLYQHSPSSRTFNSLAREVLRAAANKWPADRPLRVLEVGGGTGATAAHILPVLPEGRAEYTFTDLSPLFLARAKAKFADYPFVRFQVLDLEQEPSAQGLAAHSFDVIAASNVVHATTDVRRTLAHLRGLLAPGGWLLLLEVTRPQRWIDVTFGLTEGWWRFSDLNLRPQYPLLSRIQWRQVLSETGFDGFLTEPELSEEGADQAMILARADMGQTLARSASSPARRWLIFADRGAAGQKLARHLGALGDACSLVYAPGAEPSIADGTETLDPGSPENFASLIRHHANANTTPLHGVIYLWPLDALPAEKLDPAQIGREQQTLCGSALYLVQALARHGGATPPRLWLCTRGAQKVEVTDRVLAPIAATVWGLGKVIALEHPELRCVRLDLAPEASPDETEVLAAALEAQDQEDEIALRAGRRLGARLRRISVGSNSRVSLDATAGEAVHLSFTHRGSLENLQLEPAQRRAPGPGEVEIHVRATALNFRDVLNVMGLYPGDPGPLGAECAGEIAALGEGVTDFAVGDPVVALAKDCFASYATTSAEFVARKPRGLSFEAAITIPVAFMTAHFTLNHLAHLRAGERVLIHAAAGGVGLAAVALAQSVGAEIYATAGSPEKRELLRKLGVPHVLDSRSWTFAEEVMRLTQGKGVEVVLNSLADQFADRSFEVIAEGGRFLEIGKRGIWDKERVARLGRGIRYFIVDWGQEAQQDPTSIGSMLRELVARFDRGELKPLPHRAFAFAEFNQAFRLLAQGRHVGKLVLSQPERSVTGAVSEVSVVSEATYLITGGLGGLGLLTAQWLVERGARHLVLAGRHDPKPDALGAVRAMETKGTRVRIAKLDVSDAIGLSTLLTDIRASMPPLRGVIHSAGLLEDGLLVQQTWERFARVLAPKVTGSLLLDRLTSQDPLDFFVLFSSIASIFGSPGQGNHAAANACMDILAASRRARGLPGLSVNWGAWAGAGAAVKHGVTNRASEMGYGVIDPTSGFKALTLLLQQERSRVVVFPVDWPRFQRQFSHGACLRSLLTDLVKSGTQDRSRRGVNGLSNEPHGRAPIAAAAPRTKPAQAALKENLDSVAPNQRRGLVVQQIRRDAARVLAVADLEALPNKQPLHELGLDSLMAVELRNNIGAAFGQSLPATLLFDYPTVDALADYLCQSVLGLEAASARPERPSTAAPTVTTVLDQIEKLDDNEIDRLLKQKGAGNL